MTDFVCSLATMFTSTISVSSLSLPSVASALFKLSFDLGFEAYEKCS